MRLWIAIVAGLSLGQTQDVAPTPPADPSVRDPAASALQDAYEEAAEEADGARPPQGYVIQGPVNPTPGAFQFTPLLPDGTVPLTAGEVATQQSQAAVPPPVPTVYDSQPSSSAAATPQDTAGQEATGTGGAGAAGTAPGTATGGSGAAGTSPGTAAPPPGDGTSAAAPAQGTQAATGAAPKPTASNEALKALRERVAQLEQELEERDAVATERTQAVQSQVDAHEQRAYETERARQQRLARIQSAGQWMLAADQALEQGELGVDNALGIADEDFSVVGESASSAGQGLVVVQSERARAQIALARDAASNRDVYGARLALQTAGEELRLMRAATLERSGGANALLNR